MLKIICDSRSEYSKLLRCISETYCPSEFGLNDAKPDKCDMDCAVGCYECWKRSGIEVED